MKVVIFEGPRGSGKSSLIEDAKAYLTKKKKTVECYFLPGTTEATKQMRQLALKDSTVCMLSRRLIQIAAGLDDHLNIENIVSQSDADYVFFDRSSHISNFVYGVMTGCSEDEMILAKDSGYLYNDINKKIEDLKYVFVYADAKTCIKRIGSRQKEKDYLDLEMNIEKEKVVNTAYLGLFMALNDEAFDLHANDFKSSKHPGTEPVIFGQTIKELTNTAFEYGMDVDFYKRNSIFLLNLSTRKRALAEFLKNMGA